MITTLIAIAVFVVFAQNEALGDRRGKPNDQHAPDWQERAAFALFVAGVLTLMHQFYLVAYHDAAIEFGAMGWRFLGLCLIAYGAFTPVFRWRLNRLRGMDARYVSPSSAYDTVFMRLVFRKENKHDAPSVFRAHDRIYNKPDWNTEVVRPNRANLWINGNWYRDHIHRAGTWAYITEGLALLIGCGITLAH